MRNLYATGIMAFLVMVVLAPDVNTLDVVFQRAFFILAAVFVGYLILRHQFRLRHYTRLQRAFNSDRHQYKRWANQYRRKNHFQTA